MCDCTFGFYDGLNGKLVTNEFLLKGLRDSCLGFSFERNSM